MQHSGMMLISCELHVPCAAGSPQPAGHLLTWQGCTLLTHLTRPTARRHTMVRLEIRFLTGPSCAASLWGPRARADHARWAACTLLYKHTYNLFSSVCDSQCVVLLWYANAIRTRSSSQIFDLSKKRTKMECYAGSLVGGPSSNFQLNIPKRCCGKRFSRGHKALCPVSGGSRE